MKKKKPRCALTQQGFGEVNKGLPNHLSTTRLDRRRMLTVRKSAQAQ